MCDKDNVIICTSLDWPMYLICNFLQDRLVCMRFGMYYLTDKLEIWEFMTTDTINLQKTNKLSRVK